MVSELLQLQFCDPVRIECLQNIPTLIRCMMKASIVVHLTQQKHDRVHYLDVYITELSTRTVAGPCFNSGFTLSGSAGVRDAWEPESGTPLAPQITGSAGVRDRKLGSQHKCGIVLPDLGKYNCRI